ncbi:unnamed protein product, partial [Ixodes pacificus]
EVTSPVRQSTPKDSVFPKPTSPRVDEGSRSASVQTLSSVSTSDTALFRRAIDEDMNLTFQDKQRTYQNSENSEDHGSLAAVGKAAQEKAPEGSLNNLLIESSPTSPKGNLAGKKKPALLLKDVAPKSSKSNANNTENDAESKASLLEEVHTLLDCSPMKRIDEACLKELKEGGNVLKVNTQPSEKSRGNEQVKSDLNVADDTDDPWGLLEYIGTEYNGTFVSYSDDINAGVDIGFKNKESASGPDSGSGALQPDILIPASTGLKKGRVAGHFLFEAPQQPRSGGGTPNHGKPTPVCDKCGAYNSNMRSMDSGDIVMVCSCKAMHAGNKDTCRLLAVEDVALKEEYRNPDVLPCVVQDGVEYVLLECDDDEHESLKRAARNGKQDDEEDRFRNTQRTKRDFIFGQNCSQKAGNSFRKPANEHSCLAHDDYILNKKENNLFDDCRNGLAPDKITTWQNPWLPEAYTTSDITFDHTRSSGERSFPFSPLRGQHNYDEKTTSSDYVATSDAAADLEGHSIKVSSQASAMKKLSEKDSVAKSVLAHCFGRNWSSYDMHINKNVEPNLQSISLNSNVGSYDLNAPSTSFAGRNSVPMAMEGKAAGQRGSGKQ